MRLDVAAMLVAQVPTSALASLYSSRVALVFATATAIAVPLELFSLGATLSANHWLRVAMPAALGALAFSEMYAHGSSWPRLSRAYVMALLTFALAGVSIAALFFHQLGGAWIVPGFTVLVCLAICAVALIPKGRASWLLS